MINISYFYLQLVTRTKTAREILDEYERLAREREERRFNQITNPNVSILNKYYMLFIKSLGFCAYDDKFN